MLRKSFILLSVLLVMAMLLGACTPTAPKAPAAEPTQAPAAASNEVVTLTFWNGFTASDGEVFKELVNKFNAEHPNIKIDMTIMPWDSFNQKLLPALKAGEGPDMVLMGAEQYPGLAKAGVLQPLDEYINGSNGLDYSKYPATLGQAQVDGKWYGAPMNLWTLGMYYNKDMFKAAGLDPEKPPTNWDELYDYSKKLTKEGQYGICIPVRTSPPVVESFIWQNGGDLVTPEGKVVADSPETIEALKYMEKFWKEGLSPVGVTGPETDTLFMGKQCAIGFGGPWMLNGFKEAGLNFGTAAMPAGKTQATGAGSSLFASTTTNKHPEAAWEFFKWWNSDDVLTTWTVKNNFPPVNPALATSPEITANKDVAVFSDMAKYARSYFAPGTIPSADFDQITGDLHELIAQGSATPEEAVKTYTEKLNALIEADTK